ncbi:MAG TPA: flagellar export chaperone FliS [Longimicrobiales bacterium]|nr:flagellar export chaperone FliS [Longimicrobiales bacterium]
MYSPQRPQAYLDNEVLSASPERLVPLTYEGILRHLKRAGMQIGAGDIEGKSQSLQKALDLVYGLMGSLDFEAGGELAGRLDRLYGFFAAEILAVGRSLDRARLERLVGLIARLHEAWDEAARQVSMGHAGRSSGH